MSAGYTSKVKTVECARFELISQIFFTFISMSNVRNLTFIKKNENDEFTIFFRIYVYFMAS